MLIDKGAAYQTPDGSVYFEVASLKDTYGRLGKTAEDDTAMVADAITAAQGAGKRAPQDFALWKAISNESEPGWESPFGRGRPGWHIECSAMTHALYGGTLDVHTGGIDLKFPHHTNEMAQCDAYAGRGCCDTATVAGGDDEWCKHWLHTGHLHIEGRKMSKSLKNFISVREYFESHGQSEAKAAYDFRIFCLQHRYHAGVTYSESKIESASQVRHKIHRFLCTASDFCKARSGSPLVNKHVPGANKETSGRIPDRKRWGPAEHSLSEAQLQCSREVLAALANDLDTPRALRHILDLMHTTTTYMHNASSSTSTHLEGVIEPVLSCVYRVRSTLEVMGLDHRGAGVGIELGFEDQGDSKHNGISSEVKVGEVIEYAASVRQQLRKMALAGGDYKSLRRDLFKMCDAMRDEGFPSLGVKIEDLSDGNHRWLIVDRPAALTVPKAEDIKGQAKT